jgi:rubrerythrin
MPQEFKLQEALKLAIQTEKNVMDFYKRAAEITKNPRGKKVFSLLSSEEREHASHFHLYQEATSAASISSWRPRTRFGLLKELQRPSTSNGERNDGNRPA